MKNNIKNLKKFQNDFADLLEKYQAEPARCALLILDCQKKLKDVIDDGILTPGKTGNSSYDAIITEAISNLTKTELESSIEFCAVLLEEIDPKIVTAAAGAKQAPATIDLSFPDVGEIPHYLQGALDKINKAANVLKGKARDQRAFNQQKIGIIRTLKAIQENIIEHIKETNKAGISGSNNN